MLNTNKKNEIQHGLPPIPDSEPPLRIKDQVGLSYKSLIRNTMGNVPFMFCTVNLSRSQIGRALNHHRQSNGHLEQSVLPFSQGFFNATRSGIPIIDAYESMYGCFLRRYQQTVLGSRYKKHGQRLRWVRVYENSTKGYINEPVSHMHMALEIPPHQKPSWYISQFCDLFTTHIYPLVDTTAILNIQHSSRHNTGKHPNYLIKQLVSWEVASERVYTSDLSN